MRRRDVLCTAGVAVATASAGCAALSTSDDERNDPEERADLSLRNQTHSETTVDVVVTEASGEAVFQQRYRLGPKGEDGWIAETTVERLRGRDLRARFSTATASASRPYGPSRSSQLRVHARGGSIDFRKVV